MKNNKNTNANIYSAFIATASVDPDHLLNADSMPGIHRPHTKQTNLSCGSTSWLLPSTSTITVYEY